MSGKKMTFKTVDQHVKALEGKNATAEMLVEAIGNSMRSCEQDTVNEGDIQKAESFEEVVAAFEAQLRSEFKEAIQNLKKNSGPGVLPTHIICAAFTYEFNDEEIQKFLDLFKRDKPIHAWLHKRGVQVASHAGTYEVNVRMGEINFKTTATGVSIALLLLPK